MNNDAPLLQVRGLQVNFQTRAGVVSAVDGADLYINKAEIVGLVGESGSGKTATGLSILRLLPKPAGRISNGEILLGNKNILKLSPQKMGMIRGCRISMTFQDPMTYLNPVMRVGDQIVEAILQHQQITKARAKKNAIDWMADLRIPEPNRTFNAYPHQLSGGMKQRILIAIALSCKPSLIIADEPTTALDATIQLQIIDLLFSIRERFNTAILLITHDLGVISELCDRVYVMYAGQILEHGNVGEIMTNPNNPYTKALLKSARSIYEYHETLYTIPGSVPSLTTPPQGCRFRPRCSHASDICLKKPPETATNQQGGSFCWLHYNGTSK
ncbi:MAG: ABC transporter ATP-binding protein [Anaerolineales bacterium]